MAGAPAFGRVSWWTRAAHPDGGERAPNLIHEIRGPASLAAGFESTSPAWCPDPNGKANHRRIHPGDGRPEVEVSPDGGGSPDPNGGAAPHHD